MNAPQCSFCETLLSEHPATACLDIWAHCVRHSANCSGGPAYSRNFDAAMELVDGHPDFILIKSITVLGEDEPLTLWTASFVAWPDGPGEPSAMAGTAAHAITKAFIAAKSEEKDHA